MQPLRRFNLEELELVKAYIEKGLALGEIKPSTFGYISPIILAKKLGGGVRVCVDYRDLNDITVKNKYLLLLINKTITRVVKAKIFLKIDI